MQTPKVVVIGAGVGGLAAAIDLARRGAAVTLVEQSSSPGGKIQQSEVAGRFIDGGPTVLTMRWVFDSLFDDAGVSLDEVLTLQPADVLARHAWGTTERLDLFADVERSAYAIAAFAGPKEAQGYRTFCRRAQEIFRALDAPFMRSARPSTLSLVAATGSRGILALLATSPFTTLWKALGHHFDDPRLRQLFGRYATYVGSSPFEAPATLMLIAHVEQQGVWLVKGGMIKLAQALRDLAVRLGVSERRETEVKEIVIRRGRAVGVIVENNEFIAADAVVCAADCAALSGGLFGRDAIGALPSSRSEVRSLSAVTWALTAPTKGPALSRHNVFFSSDYKMEFDDLLRRLTLPAEPTVYICAQDRDEPGAEHDTDCERLLILVNAPSRDARHAVTRAEIEQCATRTFELLERSGLTIEGRAERAVVTSPAQFAKRFPATNGALYGQPVHGSMAAFRRPGSRSAIPGLYLAGGSVHPGPGVPMATLSGRLTASCLLEDLAST
jgi:1-hydroxycarotenoid 3,4-desaturase